MGARGKKNGGRKAAPLRKQTQGSTSTAGTNAEGLEVPHNGGGPAVHIPPCAHRLFKDQPRFAEIEESAADIRYFALKPKTHAQLKSCGVPMKLAEILLLQDVTETVEVPSEHASEADMVPATTAIERVHKGMAYAHIAAAEALRNLMANDDAATAGGSIITTLTASDATTDGSPIDISAASPSFSVRLALKLKRVWELAVETRRTAGPAEWLAEHQQQQEQEPEHPEEPLLNEGNETEDGVAAEGEPTQEGSRADNSRGGSAYLVLLRLLEELLLLTCLCVDASETTADIFATLPEFLSGVLLSILQSSVSTVMQNVQHPAGYMKPQADGTNADGNQAGLLMAMRYMKQEETKLLAKVAVAAADVVRTLTEESEGFAMLLLSSTGTGDVVSGPQLTFLNEAVDGVEMMAWMQHFFADSSTTAFSTESVSFDEKAVLFSLVQTSLHLQGALVNATSASTSQQLTAASSSTSGNAFQKLATGVLSSAAAKIKKVLPLLTCVLYHVLPMHVWSSVLPLLMQDVSLLDTMYSVYTQQQQQQYQGSCAFGNNFTMFLLALYDAHQRQAAQASEEGQATEQVLLTESARASAVGMCTAQLRCAQAAAKVFVSVIEFICEQNNVLTTAGGRHHAGEEDDDETAFRKNPLSSLLFETVLAVSEAGGTAATTSRHVNALAAFGTLLKNILWLDRDAAAASSHGVSATAGDVMHGHTGAGVVGSAASTAAASLQPWQQLLQQEQRMLTRFTEENAEVTTIQFVLLSTEVAVWQAASSLLLMLPTESLGVADGMWRALVAQVQQKHELLVATTVVPSGDGNGFGEETSVEEAATTALLSPAVQQLLWLQMEPLTNTLWTMLRKNQKLVQASHGNAAAIADKLVYPKPTDVDLLIRVFWEKRADVTVKQSCVAAVGLICTQMATAEAVTAATRFALAALTNATSPQLTFAEEHMFGDASTANPPQQHSVLLLGRGIVANSTAPPTQPQQRKAWMELLSAVDAVVSLRCEAANTLVDLFLDETYDATVYVPLHVHDALAAFQPPLKQYMKRRALLGKEMRRNYKVTVDCDAEAEQWAEVEENLVGFLQYKAAHVRV